MSPVQNIWRQLVQRRLWPVAVVLLAGLVAVPLMLAKEPDPAVGPAAVPVSGNDELATQPIVAPATAEDRARRRRVLGNPKNPFAVAQPVDAAPIDTTSPAVTAPAVTPPAGGSSPGGSSSPAPTDDRAPTDGAAPAAPDSEEPAPKPFAMNELKVRFGAVTATGELQRLNRLQPLPSPEEPVLINLGVLKNGKTAVIVLGRGVSAVGDGTCEPSPEQCYTARLKAGDVELISVTDELGAVTAQHRLELIKIHKSTTASSERANARSKAGLRLLRARVVTGGATGYRWNPEIGALERR